MALVLVLLVACASGQPGPRAQQSPPVSHPTHSHKAAHPPKKPPHPKGRHRHRNPRHDPSPCPRNPLRGVYNPVRLEVLRACASYRGTVAFIRHEEDGDYHVDVRPDPGFSKFLTRANYTIQHGELVTEVMPGQHLPIPDVGERVAVFGTWVYDRTHGWNEIHPIWAIRYLDRGYAKASLPVVPPLHSSESG